MSRRPVKKKPEEIRTDPLKTLPLSSEDWQEVEHGIALFNAGKFWQAHEAWELVWQRQSDDERLFFQGIIQLAAAYHHLTRKKHRAGYVNNLVKAEAILRVFAPEYIGIAVAPLLGAIEAGLAAARGGEDAEPSGDELALIPKILFSLPYDPDLAAAVRSAVASGEFGEGVALFNGGYHWEAHERWEEAMRDAEGEAKLLLQGLAQAAAGVNFLGSGKNGNAGYLFVKSVENLRRFGGLNFGVDVSRLVEWMEGALRPDRSALAAGKQPPCPPPKIVLNGNGRSNTTS
jgi:predicted metal-dependent hydrolase